MPANLAPAVATVNTTASRTTFAAAYIPTVRTIDARLVARYGPFNCGRQYYAKAADASAARQRLAERVRHDAIRGVPRALAALRRLLRPVPGEGRPAPLADRCPWCAEEVGTYEAAQRVGDRLVHEKCLGQFDTVMADVDEERAERAADLSCSRIGAGQYRVTGGAEPHFVDLRAEGAADRCDCGDHLWRGVTCKHIAAAARAAVEA